MSGIHDPQTLGLLFDSLKVAVMIIGRDDGAIKYFNQRVCQDLGRPSGEIKDVHYRKVFRPEFVSVYNRLQTECEDGQEHTAIYYWAEMALWEQVSAQIIRLGERPCILLSITYITEVARSEYRFESIAYFDNLLKLPNGAKLEEDINELASMETVNLIYFDIERFEDINNLYGWDNGDYLLKQVRDWLLSSEHRRAQLYRVGNGFAILGRATSLEDARDRSEEILRRFGRPWSLPAGGNTLSLYCTIKLGLVCGQYVKNEMRNILKTLDDTGFPPEKLNLEIIESAKMNFDELNLKGLSRLKDKGIILSLDDFGTGYSSFANLIRVPATSLKTEKIFLDGIVRDEHRQYFLRMLTDIAHYFDMHLIAEGVETREQLALLRQFGVDYAQGYLFSKPLSFEKLREETWRFK